MGCVSSKRKLYAKQGRAVVHVQESAINKHDAVDDKQQSNAASDNNAVASRDHRHRGCRAAVRRRLLRRLLARSVDAKAPKWVFRGIKSLSPAAPSMLYFQDLLPPLPVPDLTATCDDFVTTVATLVSAEELAQLRAGLADFCATNGPNVQKLLMERAKVWVWLGVGCCRVPVRSGGAWLTRPSILVATNGRCSCRFLGPVCTARLDCPV